MSTEACFPPGKAGRAETLRRMVGESRGVSSEEEEARRRETRLLALCQTGRRTSWQVKRWGRLLKLTVTESPSGNVSREWSLGDAR